MMINALRGIFRGKKTRDGIKISCSKDIDEYFTQQYIRNAFVVSEDKIIWHGEKKLSISAEVEPDWTFCWSKRRVWTLRQVYSLPYQVVNMQSVLVPLLLI